MPATVTRFLAPIFACALALAAQTAFAEDNPLDQFKKNDADAIGDKWAKENGGDKATAVDSYWPTDALLDLTIGKNTGSTMKAILDLIQGELDGAYKNYKRSAPGLDCSKDALWIAWQYTKNRNTAIFGNEAKKYGIKFAKDVLSLPKKMTQKILDAGQKALSDKLKDELKSKGKKAADKLTDEFTKFIQGQPNELFEDSGSWTTAVANRCDIAIRVVWVKKANIYKFMIAAKCKCECDTDTGREKKTDKIKAMLLTGSGPIEYTAKLAGKGGKLSVKPGKPSFNIVYQCCGDDISKIRSYAYRTKSTGLETPKEDPRADEKRADAEDKKATSVDPKEGLKNEEIKKWEKEIDDAKTVKELEDINKRMGERHGALKNQAETFPPGPSRDAAKELLKQIEKLLEEELGPKLEKMTEQSSVPQELKDMFAAFAPQGLLTCPMDTWYGEPPREEPYEHTTIWREPFSFEAIVRRHEECVGTFYSITTGEGYEETVVTETGDPKIVYVPPEETETPKETPEDQPGLTPPEETETPTPEDEPELTSTPETPQTPEETEVPETPQTPEETEVPGVPDLGLVKASETVVELALSGEEPNVGYEGAVVKLVPPAPPLPSETAVDDGSDEEYRQMSAYTTDVASGLVAEDGTVAIAAQFGRAALSDGADVSELVEEVETAPGEKKDEVDVGQPETATNGLARASNGFPKSVRVQVPLATAARTPAVIALNPGDDGDDQDEALKSLLAEAGAADAKVGRKFAIGNVPVYVVYFDKSTYAETKRYLNESSATYFVEEDPCRNKEQSDPLYEGSGLWGQSFDNQWAIKRVGYTADGNSAWAGVRDKKLSAVPVAVIDTGVDWFHPDLPREALWRNPDEIPDNGIDDDGNGYIDDIIGWNFVRANNKPWDIDGHGTFVAGVIAAANDNDAGIKGINPAARIMVLKALDAFGQGHASMVAQAITYAADNGARVINMSLGGKGRTQVERIAIDYARSKDALVVVAAGNAGASVADYAPAGLPGVITVSATDRSDKRAGFSNWGPDVDIAAPGVDVLSLRARDTDLLAHIPGVKYEPGEGIVGEDRAYFRATGTSFAAPIVSGSASLILSMNPDLSAEQVKRMILNSAQDIAVPGVDNYTGFGLHDAAKALTADPDFFVESRIAGVKVVTRDGKPYLQVLGTANADSFDKATLYIGEGDEPEKWLRIKEPIAQTEMPGLLIELPGALFGGAPMWTLRLQVEHKNGPQRQSNFKLTLG